MIDDEKRRGRPKERFPRNNTLQIRLSEYEISSLDYLCDEFGKNRSEIMRDALKKMYRDYLNL